MSGPPLRGIDLVARGDIDHVNRRADDKPKRGKDTLSVGLSHKSETQTGGYEIGSHRLQVGGQGTAERNDATTRRGSGSGGIANWATVEALRSMV
jgi:hypothetical protein